MSYNKFHSMSIVITGNPGVGKHTIAKEIAKNLEYSIIDINQIAKEWICLKKIKIQMM